MYEEIVALQKKADKQLAIFAYGIEKLKKQAQNIKASCQRISFLETRPLPATAELEALTAVQQWNQFDPFFLTAKTGFLLFGRFVVSSLKLSQKFVAPVFSTIHKVSRFLLRHSSRIPFLGQRISN